MPIEEIEKQARADRDYYDRIAGEYFRRHEQPIQRYATAVERRWLLELALPGSRVLLVGSGGGREIEPLLERGCELVALDYSEKMIEEGRRRWGADRVRWVQGDAHDLAAFADRFQHVVSLAAVNYFVDVELAMRQMARALAPGGTLILSSINRLHPSERGIVASAQHHRRPFSPEELAGIAAASGLAVREVRGFRHLVDRLPAGWNGPKAAAWQRLCVRAALAGEPLLQRLSRPERAKFFWLVAARCA